MGSQGNSNVSNGEHLCRFPYLKKGGNTLDDKASIFASLAVRTLGICSSGQNTSIYIYISENINTLDVSMLRF